MKYVDIRCFIALFDIIPVLDWQSKQDITPFASLLLLPGCFTYCGLVTLVNISEQISILNTIPISGQVLRYCLLGTWKHTGKLAIKLQSSCREFRMETSIQ